MEGKDAIADAPEERNSNQSFERKVGLGGYTNIFESELPGVIEVLNQDLRLAAQSGANPRDYLQFKEVSNDNMEHSYEEEKRRYLKRLDAKEEREKKLLKAVRQVLNGALSENTGCSKSSLHATKVRDVVDCLGVVNKLHKKKVLSKHNAEALKRIATTNWDLDTSNLGRTRGITKALKEKLTAANVLSP